MTRQLDDAFLDELAGYGPIGKTLGMVIRPPIDQLYLQERLDYNPLTGVLTWRYRSTAPGFDARACKIWNTRYAGTRAGSIDPLDGYRLISIENLRFKEHRVIWCLMTGEWPDNVDHDNGVRSDNRWVNLLDKTKAENNKNLARSRHNTSGIAGVAQRKNGKWWAYVSENNRTVYLGIFATQAEAVAARRQAEAERGFHPMHGRR